MSTMKDALERAGVQRPVLATDRLRSAAVATLEAGGGASGFVDRLGADFEALLLLFETEEILARAMRYLGAVRREEIATNADQTSNPRDRGLGSGTNSQSIGTAGAPSSGGRDGRTTGDLTRFAAANPPAGARSPASGKAGVRTPKPADRHKPGTGAPMDRAAIIEAAAVQARSVFALKIGMGEKTYGDITRFDCITLKRKGIVVNHVVNRLLTEVNWPDDRTPLSDCASEALAKDIHESAYRVLDRIGMTNAAERGLR